MGKKHKDLTGQIFGDGRLKVLHKAPSSSRTQWVCQCECGNICVVRGDYLKSGIVKSCGCIAKGRKINEMPERDMRDYSDSLDSLSLAADDPYQNLANAIVAVAADDYRIALNDDNPKLKKNLENFFLSDWYKVLTSVSGENLISMLRREHTDGMCTVNI